MTELGNGVRDGAAGGLRPPVISMKKAQSVYERLTGRRVRLETMRRWCRVGVRVPGGGCLRMASTRLPRERLTTELAVREFHEAWTRATGQAPPSEN